MPVRVKQSARRFQILGIFRRRNSYFFILTLILVAVISIVNGEFFTLENMRDFLRAISVSGILALGSLIVIISGGVDMSFAAVASVAMMFGGLCMTGLHVGVFPTFLISCAIGVTLGLLNSLLIAGLRIPTFIATLGMLSILRSGLILLTRGKWIYQLPDDFLSFSRSTVLSIPVEPVFYIAILVITLFIMRYTIIGKGIYAMGGNRESAEMVGFSIFRLQMFIYSYVGLLSGIAGFLTMSIVRVVDPRQFTNSEFPVIAAVVLGGASIQGGIGSVGGTFLGSVFVTILNRGLVFLKISSLWHSFIIGLIIILSVSINAIRKSRLEEKATRIAV